MRWGSARARRGWLLQQPPPNTDPATPTWLGVVSPKYSPTRFGLARRRRLRGPQPWRWWHWWSLRSRCCKRRIPRRFPFREGRLALQPPPAGRVTLRIRGDKSHSFSPRVIGPLATRRGRTRRRWWIGGCCSRWRSSSNCPRRGCCSAQSGVFPLELLVPADLILCQRTLSVAVQPSIGKIPAALIPGPVPNHLTEHIQGILLLKKSSSNGHGLRRHLECCAPTNNHPRPAFVDAAAPCDNSLSTPWIPLGVPTSPRHDRPCHCPCRPCPWPSPLPKAGGESLTSEPTNPTVITVKVAPIRFRNAAASGPSPRTFPRCIHHMRSHSSSCPSQCLEQVQLPLNAVRDVIGATGCVVQSFEGVRALDDASHLSCSRFRSCWGLDHSWRGLVCRASEQTHTRHRRRLCP